MPPETLVLSATAVPFTGSLTVVLLTRIKYPSGAGLAAVQLSGMLLVVIVPVAKLVTWAVGATLYTVPETATLTLVAPVLLKTTFPDGEPADAEAAMRIYSVPPVVDKVAVEFQLLLSEETSKLLGAVAVMEAEREEPVTETEVELEAVPVNVLSAPAAPAVIVGVDEAVPVMRASSITHLSPVSLFKSVTFTVNCETAGRPVMVTVLYPAAFDPPFAAAVIVELILAAYTAERLPVAE